MEGMPPTSQTRRMGVLLGALLTLVCALASTAAAHSLVNIHLTTSDDVILKTVDALIAVFLARLCVICVFATHDVWSWQRDLDAVPSRSNLFAHSRIRVGLAKWLLAAAAVLTPATATASTAPAASNSISASITQTSNEDPYLALESAQGAAASHQVPTQQSEVKRQPACPAIPEPEWTLPLGSSTVGCRLLGGGAPTPSHSPRTHIVQRGETVWGIAASYLPRSASNAQIAASVNAWVKTNPLTLAHPDLIQPGDTLTIPTV